MRIEQKVSNAAGGVVVWIWRSTSSLHPSISSEPHTTPSTDEHTVAVIAVNM